MEKQGARFERLLLCRSACIQHLVEIVAINVWLHAASFFFSASDTRRDELLAFCAFEHGKYTREKKKHKRRRRRHDENNARRNEGTMKNNHTGETASMYSAPWPRTAATASERSEAALLLNRGVASCSYKPERVNVEHASFSPADALPHTCLAPSSKKKPSRRGRCRPLIAHVCNPPPLVLRLDQFFNNHPRTRPTRSFGRRAFWKSDRKTCEVISHGVQTKSERGECNFVGCDSCGASSASISNYQLEVVGLSGNFPRA